LSEVAKTFKPFPHLSVEWNAIDKMN
jgi:hypothetical protein